MGIFKFSRKKIILAGVMTSACCVLMVVFPSIALCSARKGISLWLSNVLPALLPFFICANFLQDIGVIWIFRSGVFPFVMSVLSGYPMGAKIVGDLRRDGEISQREAMRLMSFCSTSGPAFMVGAVGAGMLGSGMLGGIIAAAHYAGAFLNGLLYTRLLGRDDAPAGPLSCGVSEAKGLQESFTDAILLSFRSLGIVLTAVMVITAALPTAAYGVELNARAGGFSEAIAGTIEILAGNGSSAENGIWLTQDAEGSSADAEAAMTYLQNKYVSATTKIITGSTQEKDTCHAIIPSSKSSFRLAYESGTGTSLYKSGWYINDQKDVGNTM